MRAGRGQPRRGAQRGLRANFRRGPGACGRPEREAARSGRPAESLTPGMCQAAADWAPASCAPTPGPSPSRPPAPWTPDVGPWRPPCLPTPLLFPTPGFQAEFGEAVWAKAASKDDS